MKRLFTLVMTVVLAMAMVLGVAVTFGPKPAAAAKTEPFALSVWNGATAYTTTKTSAVKYIGNYEYVDYFATLDVDPPAIGVTVTLKLQYSADNVTWIDFATVWNGVSVDTTTTPARANAIGAYMRWVTTVGTAATYTPTVKLILK